LNVFTQAGRRLFIVQYKYILTQRIINASQRLARTKHIEVHSSYLENVPNSPRPQSAGPMGRSRAPCLDLGYQNFLFSGRFWLLWPSLRDCNRSELLSAPSAYQMHYQVKANECPCASHQWVLLMLLHSLCGKMYFFLISKAPSTKKLIGW